MATPFTTVFDSFLETEVEDDSFAVIPDDLAFKRLTELLKRARGKFRDVILSELGNTSNKAEDVTSLQRQVYNFTETGSSATVTLDPSPPVNSEFYVTVNDIQTTSFTFDSGNNEMTITNMPDQENEIRIGAYVNGRFNQTLILTEENLFVQLMGLFYLNDKIKKQTLILHAVEGTDYRHSGTQGNHIRALTEQYNERERKVEQQIIMYAYRNFGFRYTEANANGYLG